MFKFCFPLFIIAIAVTCSPSIAARYEVTLMVTEGKMEVHSCFAENQHLTLSTGSRTSHLFITLPPETELKLNHANNRLIKPVGVSCFNYQVDLIAAQAQKKANRISNSWLVNNQAWLWLPENKEQVKVYFKTVDSVPIKVSVPWSRIETGYLVADNPHDWSSRMAFGDIEQKTITIDQQRLDISLLALDSPQKSRQIFHWVEQNARMVAALYGRFPVPQTQVLVVPIGHQKEAVPWAEVQRGGMPSVHYFVDQYRPISEYIEDWTGVHEMSHLLIAKITYDTRWLSEGLASYYQHVAKARGNMLTPTQAWNKLKIGFAKGRKKQSGSLRTSRSTKHIYWGGAAFYLLADLQLRAAKPALSLDIVLDRFQQCCLPTNQIWTGDEFIQKLDLLSETKVFSTLLKNEVSYPNFPLSIYQERNLSPVEGTLLHNILLPDPKLTQTFD